VVPHPWLPPPPKAMGDRGRKEGVSGGEESGGREAQDSTLSFFFQDQPYPVFGQGCQILMLVQNSQSVLPKD
jgi:hypothetical protein